MNTKLSVTKKNQNERELNPRELEALRKRKVIREYVKKSALSQMQDY